MNNPDRSSNSDETKSPTEDRMGQFLEETLRRLERGEPIDVAALLADRPDLVAQGRLLVANLASWRQALNPGVTPSSAGTSRPPAPDAADLDLPEPLSQEFRVVEELGRGAFGRVLLAQELTPLGRKLAIKTLHLPRSGRAAEDALAALQRDARFLAEVHKNRVHPNIVQVHAWRQVADQHFLVMQYVSGSSLDKLVARSGPLDWQRAACYVADVGEGLLAVHAAGIVHRDVKAANILLDEPRDEAVLTDLGVSARLATAQTVAGSPLFMAPEVFRGTATELSDVYSLAATLFFLITAEAPFHASTCDELPGKIAQGLPRPDSRCAVMPEPVEAIIRKGLAADPGVRPGLARFLAELRGSLNQAMADTLCHASGDAQGADLKLVVSRQNASGQWQNVTVKQQVFGSDRDFRKVPRQADQVKLRTGDTVRIEVQAGRDGFVTVFNVGPTGNLNLLHPDEPHCSGMAPDVRAGKPLHILELELSPPAGRERLFAVWSARPLPLSLETMRSLAAGGGMETRSYLASRDLRRLQQVLREGGGEWRVAVVELEHRTGVA